MTANDIQTTKQMLNSLKEATELRTTVGDYMLMVGSNWDKFENASMIMGAIVAEFHSQSDIIANLRSRLVERGISQDELNEITK